MSQEQLQVSDSLGSFELEVSRFKPKDMIDFSIEYFKCLQAHKPLDYKDLSGLEKFKLTPEDKEVIHRLGIQQEDLVRVINRRKFKTKEEIWNEIKAEIEKYSKIDTENADDMHYYLKFKKNTFQNNEFLRFISNLDTYEPTTDENRVYFTKVFYLCDEEKKITFDFLENDWTLMKNQKLREWKHTLERLDKTQKHSYYLYDNISDKLENYIEKIGKNEQINFSEAEQVYKSYENYIDIMKEMDESTLYNLLINKPQYERLILYDMVKIKANNNKSGFDELYKKLDKVFENFSRLTVFDFYDYILNCFIPLIKNSVKTSIEHKEMESFLTKLLRKIPKIININFLEEKKLYYDIECTKHFLNKDNIIPKLKQVFIDTIKMFLEEANYLITKVGVTTKQLKRDFDLFNLKLKEFYSPIIEFILKLIDTLDKNPINEANPDDILKSLILEYKAHSKIDQHLIIETLRLYRLFENNQEKASHIDLIVKTLIKSLSISEISKEIKQSSSKTQEFITEPSKYYYNSSIKKPKYNFEDLHYINFKSQTEVIALIIKNNKHIKSTAMLYEKEFIIPNEKYDFMIEELFQFNNMYYKLQFEKEYKDQLSKDSERIINKLTTNFKEEYDFAINDGKNGVDDYDIEKFKALKPIQQKLILTFMNYSDDYNLDNKFTDIIKKLSCIYLKDKVVYIKNKIIKEKDIIENLPHLQFIYDELKHVNYKIYIYLKHDKTNDFLTTFTKEEKEITQYIIQAETCDENFTLPDVLSIKELLEKDPETIRKQTEEYYPLVNAYILDFPHNAENAVFDFSFFTHEEKLLIIKYLEVVKMDTSQLTAHLEKIDDLGYYQYKKVVAAECEEDVGDDIKIFYRKILLALEKRLSASKTNFISCVLDYPFDPNNNYIYQNFISFTEIEKIVILEDILCRMKILDYHTLYFDNLVTYYIPDKLNEYIKFIKIHQDIEEYIKYLTEEFTFLLYFFKRSVLVFVKEVITVSPQTIYEFTNEFSDSQRKVIVLFLELLGYLTKNPKYMALKEGFSDYLIDLPHSERLKEINSKLDGIINHEIPDTLFIVVCEEIKETSFEVSYIIENIPEDGSKDEFLFTVFKTLDTEQRDILIKALAIMIEQKYTEYLVKAKEDFENLKDEPKGDSLFSYVQASFVKIKESISSDPEEKKKAEDKFNELKAILTSFCGDLFDFCDRSKAGTGSVSVRKLKAITPEKIEIIKIVLECELEFHEDMHLKKSIDYIKQLKFE